MISVMYCLAPSKDKICCITIETAIKGANNPVICPERRRISGIALIVIPFVMNSPANKQNPAVTPAASVGENTPP